MVKFNINASVDSEGPLQAGEQEAEVRLAEHQVYVQMSHFQSELLRQLPKFLCEQAAVLCWHRHGLGFSGYRWISGFRFLSESNENGFEMHFECLFVFFFIFGFKHSNLP